MLTPNFSDALLVFLYGVMGTLFVQWVMGMFWLKERVGQFEAAIYETRCRMLDYEIEMDSVKDVVRRTEVRRLAKKEKPERRTRAKAPRRAKK